MNRHFRRIGALALETGIQDWRLLRRELLLAAAGRLWQEQPSDQPVPPLLQSQTQHELRQHELTQRLGPLLDPLFVGKSTWEQLQVLAVLAESAAPPAIRRQGGIFYTPAPVAAYVVRRALSHWRVDPASPRSYLDPACGSGLFLWQVFAQLTLAIDDPELLAGWIRAAHGCDTDALALQVADFGFRLFWQRRFPALPPPQASLGHFDALQSDGDEVLLLRRFPNLKSRPGLLISNPPYVGERNHRGLFDALRSGPWAEHYRGRGDLYYFFFHLALHLQADCSALLTPSYFRTATAAAHLRSRLRNGSRLLEITDFGDLRLFPAAGGHHSLLTIFAPGQPHHSVSLFQSRARGTLREGDLDRLDAQPLQLPQPRLFQGPANVIAWQTSSLEALLAKMAEAARFSLGESFRVRQGIVSGADTLSPRQKQKLGLKQAAGTGIFVLTTAELQSLRLDANTREAWIRPWFKNSQIKAWQPETRTDTWLIYADRSRTQLPPALEQHLLPFRPLLEQRREVGLGRIPWWQLQWPRESGVFDGPKLMLPQRAKAGVAAFTTQPWYASADVYFILPGPGPWTLKALCALLNSPLLTCWWYHRGKRKGALLELYAEPLQATPLPQADAQTLLTLEAFTDSNKVDRQGLHTLVCTLYGLNDAETQAVWKWATQHTSTSSV